MNTRRYPRSTLEAFGCDAESACAIERPMHRNDSVVLWASLICLAVWLAVEYFK